jgi:hypothetical protein
MERKKRDPSLLRDHIGIDSSQEFGMTMMRENDDAIHQLHRRA